MDNSGLNKNKILQMIKNHEITSQEGLELLKQIRQDKKAEENKSLASPSVVTYAKCLWQPDVDTQGLIPETLEYNLLIFGNDNELYNAAKRHLPAGSKHRVVLVKPDECYRELEDGVYNIDPSNPEDYKKLLKDLNEKDFISFNIIHMFCKGESGKSLALEKGLYSMFNLSKSLIDRRLKENLKLLFMYDAGKNEMKPQFEAIGAFGKTVKLENPRISIKTIEINGGSLTSAYLNAALIEMKNHYSGDFEVKYVDNRRYVKIIKEVKEEVTFEKDLPLRTNGVYIITGGAGGLGFKFARYLAEKVKAKLVLVGRSDLTPDKEAKIRELQTLGAEVLYIKADISDKRQTAEMIGKAKAAYKNINGIIHSAGLLNDSFIAKKTLKEMNEVISPKVIGVSNLYNAIKSHNIDIFVMFSSITGVIGNVGQSDYAYANSFMDSFAASRSTDWPSVRTVSINWPLWRDGGMGIDEKVKEFMKKNLGLVPLSDRNGIRAFEAALGLSIPQLIVLEGDKDEVSKAMNFNGVKASTGGEAKIPDNGNTKFELQQNEKELLREKTEDYFRRLLSETTKIPYDDINPQESFEMYGMDSITAMTLNEQLEVDFGELPKTILFEYQNLEELSVYFAETYRDKLIKILGIKISMPDTEKSLNENVRTEEHELAVVQQSIQRSRFIVKSVEKTVKVGAALESSEDLSKYRHIQDEIAIIGLSGRYPRASNLYEFWENLKQGLDCIIEIPPERWDYHEYYDPEKNKWGKTNSKWGGFLEDVDKFDPLFFNISPREAHLMDPQERLFLETSWHALEDAGYSRNNLKNLNVGVFAGVMYGQYQMLPAEVDGKILAHTSIYASIANRVSYYLNLHGPSIALDTMCSSSITAIHLACDSIRKGESDMAIAGGVNVTIHPDKYIFLSQGSFLSSDGRCRSFGEGGDGYVPSEGVGAVILKPLRKALEDRDYIYAVIKGSSINHGGKTSGYTVPNPIAQGSVILETLKKSGVDPSTISYLESHGTGTALGDPIEITGLMKAFREFTEDRQFCAIGSVKSNIGHSESAAGIASLTKVLLQLKYKKLVPSIHSDRQNPNINFAETPFYVQNELSDWKQPEKVENGVEVKFPRRAGISSFGAGGANAHMIIEEYIDSSRCIEECCSQPVLFVLSAKNEERLKVYAQNMADFLESEENSTGARLIDIAYTLQVGREPLKSRLAIVASDKNELREKLLSYSRSERTIEDVYLGSVKGNKDNSELLLDGREGEEFIKIIINDGKLSKLAKLWVMGVDIDWNLLYTRAKPRRTPLPVYPFEREKYWIPEPDKKQLPHCTIEKVHPLIDKNISDFNGIKFETSINVSESYIGQYFIGEQKVLPISPLVEMMCASAKIAGNADVKGIKSIVFNGMSVLQDDILKLDTSLYTAGNGADCEIGAKDGSIYVQCKVINTDIGGSGTYEYIDIESIKKQCGKFKSKTDFMGLVVRSGFNLPEDFKAVEEYYTDGKQALAQMVVPEKFKKDFKEYTLHPALINSVLQVCNVFSGEEKIYLPFEIDSITLIKPLKEKCYMHVMPLMGQEDLKKFDVEFADDDGLVLIKIKSFSIIEVQNQPPKGTSDVPETVFLKEKWVRREIVEKIDVKVLKGNVLIFDTCEELYKSLKNSGLKVVLVKIGKAYSEDQGNVFEIDHRAGEDYKKLFKRLDEKFLLPDNIIHFWSKQSGNPKEMLENGIGSLFDLTKQLHEQKPNIKVKLVYVHLSEKEYCEPAYSAAGAFCKTIKMENPMLTYKSVGISGKNGAEPEFILNKAVSELIQDDDIEVMYRDGHRFVKSFDKLEDSEFNDKTPIKQNGAYLITGGMGGLGYIMASYLAKAFKARLILSGRSEVNAAIDKKLSTLREYGAEVLYVKADVSNEQDVAALVKRAKDGFGSINGVIHCAGINKDAFIIKKSKDDMDTVLASKVYGTIHMDEALKEEQLDFFVLFSSIVAITGNVGQSDYSFANSFLDGYARYRENLLKEGKRKGKTLSINWPHWKDGGMQISDEQRKILASQTGLISLLVNEGLRAWETAIKANIYQCIVSHGDQEKALKFFNGIKSAPKKIRISEDLNIGKEVLTEKAESMLEEICSELFTLSIDKIDSETDFEEYGIDSVMITQFNLKIEQKIGALPKTILFENRNIYDLTRYLTDNYESELAELFGLVPKEFQEEVIEEPLRVSGNIVWKQLESFSKSRTFKASGKKSNIDQVEDDIAVIGISGRYPFAGDLIELWRNIENKRDCISEIPPERWDYREYFDPDYVNVKEGKMYSKWGGFLEDADKFDPLFFNISPIEAEIMDPQERIFLETIWETLEDAGYTRKQLRKFINREDSADVGVFVGVTSQTYQLWGPEEFVKGNPVTPNSSAWSLANRASYLFNFYGPSMPIDTACSSSLTAIHIACESLKRGECSTAIAGGVNLYLHPLKYVSMCQMRMLSPSGKCHAFGEKADGFVPGEGVGAVLLKPLKKAVEDGDNIYGVIKSTAINHGGKTNGYTVPNPNAQASLISEALKKAGINPRTITCIEAHGTGTKLGDPIEISGLTKAFGEYTKDRQYCSIGSVKANIGHLESAAGIASLTKVLLMMKRKKLAPSIHAEVLNSNIDFTATPFYVQKETMDWDQPCIDGKTYPRRAGISSFGAGGANAHVIVEEYCDYAEGEDLTGTKPCLISLSAKNRDRLRECARKIASYIETDRNLRIESIAYTLQVGREAMEERLAIIAESKKELLDKLRLYLRDAASVQGVLNGNVRKLRSVASSNDKRIDLSSMTAEEVTKESLTEIAELWVKGEEIDWITLYKDCKPKRISLPTYPFKKDSFYIKRTTKQIKVESVAAVQAVSEQEKNDGRLSKLFYTPRWTSMPLPETSSKDACKEEHESTLIVYPKGAETLVKEIEKLYDPNRIEYIVLGCKNVMHSDKVFEADIKDAFSIAGRIKSLGNINSVYFLGGIQIKDYSIYDLDELGNIQDQAVVSFFRLVKAMSEQGLLNKHIKFKIITNNVFQITPGEEVMPFAAGLNGFIRNMVKEYPEISASLIDISLKGNDQDAANAIKAVLKEPDTRNVEDVAVRNGRRYVRKLLAVDLPPVEDMPLAQNGVYMVIGGLGSIGYDFAKYAAAKVHARIAIIGRSELTDDGAKRISLIENLGAQVIYIRADSSNDESMRSAVLQIKSLFGKINGVVHSAMVFTPSILENVDEKMFRSTLAPKVTGTVVLAEVMKDEDIDFMMFFSSGQAFTGNVERVHYAAACNFEDDFAIALRSTQSYKVSTINWGFWGAVKGEPVVEEYARILEQQGVIPISPEVGMETVRRTLAYNMQQIATFNVKDYVLDLMGIDLKNKIRVYPEIFPSLLETLKKREISALVPENMDAFKAFRRFTQIALLDAFKRMGVFKASGEEYGVYELRTRLGIITGYNRLYEAMLDILTNSEMISIEEDRIKTQLQLDSQQIKVELEELNKKKQELTDAYSELKPYVRLLWACTSNLPAILKGEITATGIMFPNSSMELVEGIYKGNKNIDYFNNLVVEGVKAYIEARLPYLKEGERIKIIEVGAGTGGTSALVLNAISEYGDKLLYMYTDISMAFIQYGKREYGVHYPFMDFKVLNLENDISSQGFVNGEYDLAVASNVLHATKLIRDTLGNIKVLLKNKGWLVINEATQIQDFSTLTFGLTEGWWLYEDEENRMKGSPLLSLKMWEDVLKEEGYRNVSHIGKSSIEEELIQHVVIAESDGQVLIKGEHTDSASAEKKRTSKPMEANEVSNNEAKADTQLKQDIHRAVAEMSEEKKLEEIMDKVEEKLIECVADVLQMDKQDIDSQIPFMDFGVDSILGVKIISIINERLGVDLAPTDLFDYSTIEKLSDFITNKFPHLNSVYAPASVEAAASSEDSVHETAAENVTDNCDSTDKDEEDYIVNLFRKLEARKIDVDDISDLLGG